MLDEVNPQLLDLDDVLVSESDRQVEQIVEGRARCIVVRQINVGHPRRHQRQHVALAGLRSWRGPLSPPSCRVRATRTRPPRPTPMKRAVGMPNLGGAIGPARELGQQFVGQSGVLVSEAVRKDLLRLAVSRRKRRRDRNTVVGNNGRQEEALFDDLQQLYR